MTDAPNTQTTSERIKQWVMDHVQIEQKKRTMVSMAIILLHYAMDYVILWLLLSLSFVSTSNLLPMAWPFLIIRVISSVFFIFLQHPSFFLLDKLSIMMELIFASNFLMIGEILVVLIEVVMSAVWTLTKEQRMSHFDSRLGLLATFTKQSTFYLIFVINLALIGLDKDVDREFCLLSGLLVLLLIDYSDQFYVKKTKEAFVRLDLVMIVLLLVGFVGDIINITFFQFVFSSLILLAVALLHLTFSTLEPQKILIVPTQDIQCLRSRELWEYLVQIKRRLVAEDSESVQTFLFKLKEETDDEQLLHKIKLCEDKNIDVKKDIISGYLFDILRRTAKETPNLRDLALFLYTPSPRMASFLDQHNWHHRREYHRVITEEVTDQALQQTEAHNQLMSVRSILTIFSSHADYFYQQLMRERILEQKVMQLGLSIVGLLHQLKQIASAQKTNHEVGQLLNRFCELCLPSRYKSLLSKAAHDEQKIQNTIDAAQILVGGDESDLKVLSVNMNFIRMTYHRRDRHRSRRIGQLIPQPFVEYLNLTLKKEVANQYQRIKIYMFNKSGYLSICQMQIQPATHNESRVWRLLLREQFASRCLVVLDAVGRFVGCSELCRYYGFSPQLLGSVLSGTYIEQLHGYSTICLYVKDHPFDQTNFSPYKDIVLINVDNLKLPVEGIELYVLEVKESDHHLRLTNVIVPQHPPNFEFHYDWSGKISNVAKFYPIQLNTISDPEIRPAVNYGENITQMRYFMGKIDYKSNFEEQQSCPSLPLQLQQALSSLTAHEYYERWDHKKQATPSWLRGACLLTILLTLMVGGASIFIFMQFNTATTFASNNLTLTCLLEQKLLSVIRLATLTTAPNLSLNATQLINDQVTQSNSISNSIFILNQNIFGLYNGQTILDGLNSLILMINSYLLNPNYNYTNALLLITTSLQPNFHSFLNSFIGSVNSNLNSYSSVSFTVLIVTSVLSLVFIVILAVLQWMVKNKKTQIIQILKFIDTDYLQIYRNRLIYFKQMWLDNGEVEVLEQEEEDHNQETKSSTPKRLLKAVSISWSNIYSICWLVLVIVNLSALYSNVTLFINTSSNLIDFNSHLAKQISHLQTIWAEYNNPSPNMTRLSSNIGNSLNEQYLKVVQLSHLSQTQQISSDFINFYKHFWQQNSYCNYVSPPDCLTFIGGASHEGANMITNFLNRAYDSYLINNFTASPLYSLPDSHSAGIINFFYLYKFVEVNNHQISDQFARVIQNYNSEMVLMLVASLINSALILVLLLRYRAEHLRVLQLQELLMVIPFDRLKSIPSFHRFYLAHYSSY